MVVPNDKPSQRAPYTARLTHVTFYKVCEVFKKHRQRFLDERPTQKGAAKLLTELSGIQVSENSIPEIQESTGVTWKPKYGPPKGGEMSKARAMALRTLTMSLVRLYRKLDEEIPSALAELYTTTTGRELPQGKHRPEDYEDPPEIPE